MTGWPLLTKQQATDEMAAYWPGILRARARDRLNTLDEETVRGAITAGVMWVVWDGETVCVLAIQRPVCAAVYASGSLETLARWSHQAEHWARGMGCNEIRLMGRPGWVRALPGYTVLSTVIGKVL